MVCIQHPNRQAISICEVCGQPFCEECLVEVAGKFYCKEHVAELVASKAPPNYHHGPNPPRESQPGYGYGNPHHPSQGYGAPHHPDRPPNINIYNAPSGGYYGPGYGYYPYKNKVVALLLCIFLGLGGFHRFYVGKIGTGVLYLFTGGLFGIGWIVDIIRIAVGSFSDVHGYPLI